MPSSDQPPAHADHHDPRFDLDRQDALTMLALGQSPAPELAAVTAHIDSCADCQTELTALRHTVGLARDSVAAIGPDVEPPPRVWQGIASELALPTATVHPHRRWRSRALLAAAAVVIAGAGVVGGYLAGRENSRSVASVSATAQLTRMPGGPSHVRGAATVHSTTSGTQLSVRTAGLPLRHGYYEVWLFDPAANKMVAIGTLPQAGSATYPVPPGLDVRDYHVVDVSAQNFDGNAAHERSVLRGRLTQ